MGPNTSSPSIAVVAEYPLSLKNGAGYRVLLQQLSGRPLTSIYLGDRRSHADPAQAARLFPIPCQGSGVLRLIALALGFLAREGLRRDSGMAYVLMPNSHADLALGLLYTVFRKNTLVWWMDDFVERADFSPAKIRLGRFLRARLHRRAKARVTVSQEMRRHFESLFPDIPIEAVISKKVAELSSIPRHEAPHRTLKLFYIGSFDWPYLEPFEALRKVQDIPFTLDLYGVRPPPQAILSPGRIEYRGPLAGDRFNQVATSYDYGLVPYGFSPMARSFMAHSFPSKLIDYLGAGLPVWTIAPSGLGFIPELHAHDVGPILHDLARLPEALRALQVPAASYRQWSKNALAWAKGDFLFREGELLALLEGIQK